MSIERRARGVEKDWQGRRIGWQDWRTRVYRGVGKKGRNIGIGGAERGGGLTDSSKYFLSFYSIEINLDSVLTYIVFV